MALRSLVGFLWNGTSDKDFGIADPKGVIASFEVDAVLSETTTFSREVTTNPVENGSPIADHIIKNPIELEIQAIVTDAPIKGLIENYTNAVDNLLKGSQYTADCFGALFQFWEYQGFLTVYTQYRAYENMVIENITIPRDPKDGEALVFNIRMVQVRVVSSATTTLPKGVGVKPNGKSNAAGKTAHTATPNKDIGKNNGAEIDDGASILKRAGDSASSSISDIMSKVKGALGSAGL